MGFRIAVQGRVEGASDKESTHVELNVNHHKDRKLAYLRVGPLEVKDGWETRRIAFGMSNFLNLEPMPRLNRKRLAALLEDVKHQVSEKSGPAWELFQAVCAENGLIPCDYKRDSCEVVKPAPFRPEISACRISGKMPRSFRRTAALRRSTTVFSWI